MNTNEHKMIGLQFTSLATKQGSVDMKIRRLASQQNAPTSLCGVRRQHILPGSGEKNQMAFIYLGNAKLQISAK